MKNTVKHISHTKHGMLLMFLIIASTFLANAQNTITGHVTDEKQQALPGTNVVVKGTRVGTISDSEGNYKIDVSDQNTILQFSYIGYLSKEVPIQNRSVIDVQLLTDIGNLEQVVVVGYGTQKKADLTGSVAVVDVKQMNKSNSVTITDRLQGRVAGVSVSSNGEPGSIGSVKIRGTSFFGNNDPLYVIDGVLTDDGSELNPDDIESLQVLKDASSSSIYGSRAANGVIIIETKKGRKGKPEITFNSNFGIQQIPKRLDLTNSEQWARISNAASDYAGIDRQNLAVNVPDYSTDWQDEVFKNGLLQDFNLSISGGGEKSKAFFSINDTYQEGTITGPLFERLSTRLNTEYELAKGLKIGENLTVSGVRAVGQGNPDVPGFGTTIQSIAGMLPVIPVYDPYKLSGYGHGELGEAYTFNPNPVGQEEMFRNLTNSQRILGNVFASYEIIDGLEYRFSAGLNTGRMMEKSYNKAGRIRMSTDHLSGLSENRSENISVFLENRLTYNKTLGNHKFSAMATMTEQQNKGRYQGTTIEGGFDGENPIFQISATSASPNQITSNGGEYTSVIRSYLGRLTYNYADRYLLTANIRRDGSSKFPEENRWGTFPSVSAGWNLAKEEFFNVSSISNLKIRAGYGEVGNASIGDYQYQSLIQSQGIGGVNYNLGPDGLIVIGATRGAVVNTNLKWEVLKETNIGLDLDMFEGKLGFNGDIYIGNMEDLLADVPQPGTIGEPEPSDVTLNAVSMKRRGWEATLTYRKMTGDFNYSVMATLSHTENEITALPNGVDEFIGENSVSRLGLPLGQLYLMDYEGIYNSQDQIDALPGEFSSFGEIPELGDAIYKDTNGRDTVGNLTGLPDGKIDWDDRKIAGNPMPYLQYGLNIDMSYKNFDFTLFLQGWSKHDVFNSAYSGLTYYDSNFPTDFDPFIDGAGKDPRVYQGAVINGESLHSSTYYMENAGYLSIKILQLGYSIPWSKVKRLRVYVSAQNLFVFTKYRGYDPQFEGGVFDPGVDPIGYPNIRTYNAGFSLTF